MNKISDKIKAWFFKVFDREESLSIAGINTTLIAVFVACLSVYIVFVFNTVQQAEMKAVETAENINNITFLVHQCPYGAIDVSDAFDREKIVGMWFDIIYGFDDQSSKQDIVLKARKVLGIMSVLVNQYPFPI